MHLLPTLGRSLDDDAAAVDLDLTPADILFLSFTDSDLGVVAAAWPLLGNNRPSLRIISLARLRHPYSVDLFIEKLAAKSKVILVRLLGGADYWRYGLDELAASARAKGIALAVLPGDGRDDPRLLEASTVPPDRLAALQSCFEAGGAGAIAGALRLASGQADGAGEAPATLAPAGVFHDACRGAEATAPHLLLLFYRSSVLADDTAPVLALADAAAARSARVSAIFVASLKDPASKAMLAAWLATNAVDAIVNLTAFSARDEDGHVLDRAEAPIIQAITAGSDRESWLASGRGLRAADLAMNVVLPEVDGRISGGVISFKTEADRQDPLEFAPTRHRPDPEQLGHVIDRALGWARLRRLPNADKRLACILSDYPGKEGRAGFAVGLDTPASLIAIADDLRAMGYGIEPLPSESEIMRRLTEGESAPALDLETYRELFGALPEAFRAAVEAAWGDPAADEAVAADRFAFRFIGAGHMLVAIQPDRGRTASRRTDYHDTSLPPRHGYIAFYLWLRFVRRIHAMIHLGTHGTLEWLPGKAVALSQDCAPAVLTGDIPVIYPFIVNNPGEAAQAKRRIGAVTIGHLTPPLVESGTHGDTAELEQLFDEYAEASTVDPRRAKLLSQAILDKAKVLDGYRLPLPGVRATVLDSTGQAGKPSFRTSEAKIQSRDDRANEGDAPIPGSTPASPLREGSVDESDTEILAALDAWLCDIKEMRIGDGLHVFGREQAPSSAVEAATAARCAAGERAGLLAALGGRFVQPGPAGVPGRGRADVLPTGRNLFSVDPRAIPSRTAWELGWRMAEDLVTRYAQDHGDWPRRVVLDLWGSATVRTGGDNLAQAMALLGVKPRWDHASARVTGFDVIPLAKLGRARVDCTLRISGLFRDMFPDQIGLFDAAVRMVATLDEEDGENPVAEAARRGGSLDRIFGAQQGTYGIDLDQELSTPLPERAAALAESYLGASPQAFGLGGEGTASEGFRERVASADAFSHAADLPGQDVLDADTFAAHEGGFAAAARHLGATPSLYRSDTSAAAPKIRTLAEDVQRALLGRATNPKWIAGQMRHGYRGAIAMAETLDSLFAFAATTDVVPSGHFDRYFDATLGDDAVRDFLVRENPGAAQSMADRFEAALESAYWVSRRNSVRAALEDVRLRRSSLNPT